MAHSGMQERLSYVCGTGEIALLGKCIGQVLDTSAEKWPDNDCLVVRHQSARYSYGEFYKQVELAARAFLNLGIQKGDRVGIWSTNCAEWVITQFATAKIGAILVNINPLNRAFELEYVLRQSECQVLLLAEGFRDNDYVSTLEQACGDWRGVHGGKIRTPKLAVLKDLIFLGACATRGMKTWAEFLNDGEQVSLGQLRSREAELEFDDGINIQYTSGTTGFPKGATLSHHNIVNNALLIANSMRFSEADRLCIPVPFYHCFGMVLANMACVVSGATMVIPAASFDPELTLRAVQEERCTALHGVPTMFIAELEHPRFREFDLSTLRTGIMAGSPCPIEVMKRVVNEMHCREMTIAYGLTESSPVITQTRADDPIEVRVTTVGKALPHTEVKIVDPGTNKTVPIGHPGELCTRGYHVMKGYYKNDQATRSVIDADGWLHTGDLAVVDERGYFNITGRAKDVIIRGGENVYPREVEEFLYTHPSIVAVQVVGVPDAKYGEAIAAWVKIKPRSTLTLEELKEFCKGRIADFKIPRYLKITNDFPMTITGKIQKFRMKEISIQEFGLQKAASVETA